MIRHPYFCTRKACPCPIQVLWLMSCCMSSSVMIGIVQHMRAHSFGPETLWQFSWTLSRLQHPRRYAARLCSDMHAVQLHFGVKSWHAFAVSSCSCRSLSQSQFQPLTMQLGPTWTCMALASWLSCPCLQPPPMVADACPYLTLQQSQPPPPPATPQSED